MRCCYYSPKMHEHGLAIGKKIWVRIRLVPLRKVLYHAGCGAGISERGKLRLHVRVCVCVCVLSVPCVHLGVRLPPRLAGCTVQYTRGVHGGIDNFPATI